jgi:hypothetical protein
VPLLAWIPQYRWRHLQGDLIAAITMASFYIPMALSLASNLAHVPPINGLYSFVFNPVRSMLITCSLFTGVCRANAHCRLSMLFLDLALSRWIHLAQIFSCYEDVLFSDHTRIKHVTYFFDSLGFPHQAMLTTGCPGW